MKLLIFLFLMNLPLHAEISEEAAALVSSGLDNQAQYRPLTLSEMIEQGIRKNYLQKERDYKHEFLKLERQDLEEGFWLPKLQVNLSTDPTRVGTLYNGSKDSGRTTNEPKGRLSLGFADYTLFNWGIDYLDYLIKRRENNRSVEELNEKRRTLRHELISRYFQLSHLKQVEEIRKNHVRQTSFIYRVSSERAAAHRMPKSQYYLSRSEYLESQNIYRDAKLTSNSADEQIAFLISDQIGTRYSLTHVLDYQKIKVTLDEATSLSKERNSGILSATKDVEVKRRELEIAEKENLPLPKFTMNLGAYTYGFSTSEGGTRYETSPGNSNIEVIGTLNATWPLWGENGFMNSRKLHKAVIEKSIAENSLAMSQHRSESEIRLLYQEILLLQDQISILEIRKENGQKTYDAVLENYLSNQGSFMDLSKSLNDLFDSQVKLSEAKFLHLHKKLTLAELMGLDDFIGENFEKVAQRVEAK